MAKLSVVIGQSHSLKEKRMVIRRIKDRVRERAGVVMNEVGSLETWQRGELGCAVVSGDRQKAFEVLDEVVRIAIDAGGAEVVAVARDVWKFEVEAAPLPDVDDRTGSGDKAAGRGDEGWIPEEWREEAKS
jgi:uncharacterized protein YlxP (DUF503 family)